MDFVLGSRFHCWPPQPNLTLSSSHKIKLSYWTYPLPNSASGRAVVGERIKNLFEIVKSLNAHVFSSHERISVGDRSICDVVIELQQFQLLTDLSDSHDWDIMGHAYEEYTATYLKRKKGQFFTNRLVIDFLVAVIDPTYTDIILDPAGGSGGFLTGALRYVRIKVLGSSTSPIAKQRQLDRIRTRLFMIDISKRLVKVAKTAMILNGDGHAGMTTGDSLGPYTSFDETIVAQANQGSPTVILTNPPFAGVGDGRIVAPDVLERFSTGKRWINDGAYRPTGELLSEGAPPELLFFERCIDWLAPGGKLGIVLPKSFLDTQTYMSGRAILFEKCKLLAVINCHKNTFQPHTGVRTSLLVIEKMETGKKPPKDYPIFMAISKKIGQDSEGVPIFKRDSTNKLLDDIDCDLDDILSAYKSFLTGNLHESEYTFSISRSEIDDSLRINPQAFLPSLNETLQKVAGMDGVTGWSVTSLGQLDAGIKIFKGPRFSSENLNVEGKVNDTTETYFTPSAILQEKSDSVKWIDVSRASKSQQRTIAAIRVKEGDIVITRSGSIGRVAYITRQHHNAIVSDDLIRVRVSNEKLRVFCFMYLQTKFAQDQMLRNEYGAIQQHLEPEHVRDLLIPVPDDWSQLDVVLDNARKVIQLKNDLFTASESSLRDLDSTLGALAVA